MINARKAAIWGAAVLLVLAAGAAFVYMLFFGLPLSPDAKADRMRINGVAEARDWVRSYYQPFTPTPDEEYRFPKALIDAARASGHWGRRLPPSLIEAGRINGVDRADALTYLDDPTTHEPVAYRHGKGSAYELCVTFATAERFSDESAFWNHPAGLHCYAFNAAQQPGYPASPEDRLPRLDTAWFKAC